MKLSIITINKDNAVGLEKTIQSVIAQTFRDYEYIVIDGASDDGGIEVIKKYADKITYWMSESDTGIYNAMNKGIKAAYGDFCLFLNSADCLINEKTLQNVFDEIARLDEADIYYSDCVLSNNVVKKSSKYITLSGLILICDINHQNTLIRRTLFLQHGLYNEKLTITADREFWLKEKWMYNSKFTYIKTNISIYDKNGISSKVNFSYQHDLILYNVFGDLANLLIEWRNYRRSIYFSIISQFGNMKMLNFILRGYRFIARLLDKLKSVVFQKRNNLVGECSDNDGAYRR
jgi:glycosyltransferase involved in cell wall biosynthesis